MRPDNNFLLRLESARKDLRRATPRATRSATGQFFTPAPIACFMASLFQSTPDNVRILDAGAGTGALFAALVAKFCSDPVKPNSIEIVAYESDDKLVPYLRETLSLCGEACAKASIPCDGMAVCADFISAAVEQLHGGLFSAPAKPFTHAILNPPYRKVSSHTHTRTLLNAAGVETSNLYSGFVWLAIRLLLPGGEIVAITPRSFCNGPYFRPFRKSLLELIGLKHIHLFESRKQAFADDSVLQENVILYGIRGQPQPPTVKISVSKGADLEHTAIRRVPFAHVVLPQDPDGFIRLTDDEGEQVTNRMARFNTTLKELGLQVSTGRVVEFRAREYLRDNPGPGAAPLVHPCHFHNGFISWPVCHAKKPNAIVSCSGTQDLLVRKGYYVLTKRFSAKEERRRVDAAVYDPNRVDADLIGFENHLNYFHANGAGLTQEMAKGLAVFLNSTIVDRYFRLFSGHTQVNATDLRKMPYPSSTCLLRLGRRIAGRMPDRETIDAILDEESAKDA